MSKIDIKQAKWEMRNLAELTNWENNPRSILKEEFDRLKENIEVLGIHNGLLVNQDNIVLGGNMRLRAFLELNNTYNLDQVMCRVVETADEGQMLQYALNDNDQFGVTDDLKLAEVYALHPIEMRLHKLAGNILRPLESVINPPDPATLGGGEPDQSDMDETLSTYLSGNVKQIVLYYNNDAFQQVVERLEVLGKELALDNHTDLITKLINQAYEGITPKEETT